jgi:hypothetical protein
MFKEVNIRKKIILTSLQLVLNGKLKQVGDMEV